MGWEPLLVEIARKCFSEESTFVRFLDDDRRNELLNDLDNNPHAFVLACLMDRQMRAERAWEIPSRIYEELGTFNISKLGCVSREKYVDIFTKNSLHRFNEKSAEVFYLAIQDIINKYEGNAARIWSDRPSSASVVYRFLEFKGCGIKIATMAANILARQFKIPFSDHYSIDISPDIHVQRVMHRMGFVDDTATIEMIIYKARELSPEFPGLIDFSCWEIGKNYCRPTSPNCKECIVSTECKNAFSI